MANPGESEKFAAGTGSGAQGAEHGRSDCGRAGGAHAAQGHAGMFGADHDTDRAGLKVIGEPVSNLLGQTLVNLRAAGEVLDHPGKFR